MYNIHVCIYILDSDGQPIIKPMSRKQLKKFRKEGGKNVQMIASMSMDIWKVSCYLISVSKYNTYKTTFFQEFDIGIGFLQQHRLNGTCQPNKSQ